MTLHGSVLIGDELYLMNGYSSVTKRNVPEWYKVSLSDPSYKWSIVAFSNDNSSELSFDSYGYTYFDTTILIFAGDKNPPIMNDLLIFDLQVSPITYYFYDMYYSPSPRMYHSMQPLSKYLYLFGGLGVGGELYNDLWAFDCMDEVWAAVDASGDIPPKRYGHATTTYADLMLVWGGYGANGYLNDGYMLDKAADKWHVLTYTGDVPSSRVGACAVLIGTSIFLYRGLTESGLSDELWVYELSTNKYTLIDSENTKGPEKLYYATCAQSDSNPNFVYILYGEAEDEKPLNSVFTFNLSSKAWITNYTDTDDLTWARAKSSIYKLQNRILIIGGESFGDEPNDEIFYFDTNNNEHTQVGTLETSVYAAAFAYFQNYIYIHGGGTAVGSILRFNVPSDQFIRIHLWTDCDDNTTCFWACSLGTYRNNDCNICPPGTYTDGFNHTICSNCIPGKYMSRYGGTTKDQCYPCPEGTYSKALGASTCLDCPYGAECQAGSVYYTYNVTKYEDKSIQPALYSTNTDKIKYHTLIIQAIVGFVGLWAIILLVFIAKGRKMLECLDLYATNHNHIIGEIMYLKRNWLGGTFTIIFIFLAIMTVGVSLINYSLNNVYEVKSLVPLVVLEQDVDNYIGDFTVIVTLNHYGGNCMSDNDCSSELVQTISGIYGDLSKSTCKAYDNGNCEITMICKNCEILESAKISFANNNINGYTSGFTVNMTSSSSIPNEKSSYETTVQASTNYVFLGNDQSIVYFYTIPSYYSEIQNDKNHTGYHISLKQASKKGSEYRAYEFSIAFYSYLDIEFDIGTNGLVTTRNVRQTWIILITTLLGSVFGIMGSIGGIMKLVEKDWINISKKLTKESELMKVQENADAISSACGNPSNYLKISTIPREEQKLKVSFV